MGKDEGFVVVDRISATESKFILIVEAKRSSLGAAMEQCLLPMKDVGDSSNGSVVCSFITTGESWRMLSYDGASFQVTEKTKAASKSIGKNKESPHSTALSPL